MTDTVSEPAGRRAARRIRAILGGQFPFVVTFCGLLSINWGVAFWLVHDSYRYREAAALQLVDNEAKYSEQKIATLFKDADRTLLALRGSFPAGDLQAELQAGYPGEIALIAPDGRVLASTPHANTAGWPGLMAQLATSADILAMGGPVPGKAGHLGFVPLARRVTGPDGSFGGILLFSLEGEAFPDISPAVKELDGCMSLVADDGVILARAPDVRGTVGIRMPWTPPIGSNAAGTGRSVSRIDGVDRIFAYRRLQGMQATLMVGVGYDATFAGWRTLRLIVLFTRVVASALILLAAWLWYTRRHRANISATALSAILNSIDRGIRVENADGKVVAANAVGAALQMPDDASRGVESRGPDGSIIQITRHDVTGGGTVLIGNDVTHRRAAEARIDFLTHHDALTGLPNRWRAASRIQALIEAKAGSGRMAALILCDLDGFRDINDTLGHAGGDEVLTEVAARLRDLAGDRDVVARLGGDEFLLFLNDPDDETAVMCLARRIPRALARPVGARGQQVRLGASLGIALHPRDGADLTTLFQHADIAMSRAKLAGRGTAQSSVHR